MITQRRQNSSVAPSRHSKQHLHCEREFHNHRLYYSTSLVLRVVQQRTVTNAMGKLKMLDEVLQAGYTTSMSVAFCACIAMGPMNISRLHINVVMFTDMSHEVDGIASLTLSPTAVTHYPAHYCIFSFIVCEITKITDTKLGLCSGKFGPAQSRLTAQPESHDQDSACICRCQPRWRPGPGDQHGPAAS